MAHTTLVSDIERACRHLLSELNRDGSTPSCGCFDRRYWSWKLVDFPEATFQRNVYPLAWWFRRLPATDDRRQILADAVIAGLRYSTGIQHRDGSFDQAFPNEHSFGATAFLLDPLLAAFLIVRDLMDAPERAAVEASLRRAADFLCGHDETHGHIANHLAGAVWSLVQCADTFADQRYERRAVELLDRILAEQSEEGWFLEYEGADPGYQTLCVHYLAQVAGRRRHARLDDALARAVAFLSWCVHPDGSFGGEYGSRRTAVYYPGGIALLADRLPMAKTMTQFMAGSMAAGTAVGLADVDMGNLAPLASSCMLLVDAMAAAAPDDSAARTDLPWQRAEASGEFPEAGFKMRGLGRFYSVFGTSNGGVLKVFDRESKKILLDDGGYLGETESGRQVTTQVTDRARPCRTSSIDAELDARFFDLSHPVPTPAQFLVLRLLNLSVMRSIRLGNLIKAMLVRLLISGRRDAPLRLTRQVTFAADAVTVRDSVSVEGNIRLRRLECGRPFVAVHMASSRYFPGFAGAGSPAGRTVDVAQLAATGRAEVRFEVS